MPKTKILIVGSFKETTKDGHLGGQRFACRTLINSKLSERVHWLCVDSTSRSVITPPFYERVLKAILRFFKFILILTFRAPKSVIIFTVDGFGFIEKGSMALLAKAFGKKVIMAPRSGLIPRDLRESKFLSKFIPYVFERCDFIICQSEKWRLLFAEHMSEESKGRLVVVENWIDTDKRYAPTPRTDELRIVFLGWIEKTKGVFDLYEGFKLALHKTKNIRLQYAGNGGAFDKLKALVNQEGYADKIDFLGWVTKADKQDLLNQAHVFVLPSFFEGFPNSLLEAMLYGKACIATRVGSVEDIIIEEHNGFLMEIGEVEKIGNTIIRLESDGDILKCVGDNARERILKGNSIDSAITRFEQLLDLG